MKKVQMKMPVQKSNPVDSWVSQQTTDVSESRADEKVVSLHAVDAIMKRFTIDVAETLHKRIKSQCAIRGTKMADVIRDLLEREFPEDKA